MSVQSVAAERLQAESIRRSDRATREALRLWQQVPVADLDAGWAAIEADLVGAVSAVVAQNAAASGAMVSRVARADGVGVGDSIVHNAFVGVDSSGRDVGSLLHGSVTTTKEQIGWGRSPASAFVGGASYLAAMMKTVIADSVRSASAVASAGRGYVRYIRMVSPGACSRCAILAGSDRFSKPFERHPACRCTSVPVRDISELPEGLHASPEEHFRSLSRAEQDRIYGKAGAEAIRLGADPIQVVGARRGASGMLYSRARPNQLGQIRRMQRVPIGVRADGSQIFGYTTLEGTTKRGAYGRAQSRIGGEFARVGNARYSTVQRRRLMPESIFEATSDPDMRRILLRDAGYLEHNFVTPGSNEWIQQRLRQQQLDRVAADSFYRSLGIDLY